VSLHRRLIQRYLAKISGPLLDRIDLHIEVPAVAYKELRSKQGGITSAEMRERVTRSRVVQTKRGFYNSQIPVTEMRGVCALDEAGERTLELAVRRMGLSARAHDRILKVARTIADLEGIERVSAKNLARLYSIAVLIEAIGVMDAGAGVLSFTDAPTQANRAATAGVAAQSA